MVCLRISGTLRCCPVLRIIGFSTQMSGARHWCRLGRSATSRRSRRLQQQHPAHCSSDTLHTAAATHCTLHTAPHSSCGRGTPGARRCARDGGGRAVGGSPGAAEGWAALRRQGRPHSRRSACRAGRSRRTSPGGAWPSGRPWRRPGRRRPAGNQAGASSGAWRASRLPATVCHPASGDRAGWLRAITPRRRLESRAASSCTNA